MIIMMSLSLYVPLLCPLHFIPYHNNNPWMVQSYKGLSMIPCASFYDPLSSYCKNVPFHSNHFVVDYAFITLYACTEQILFVMYVCVSWCVGVIHGLLTLLLSQFYSCIYFVMLQIFVQVLT